MGVGLLTRRRGAASTSRRAAVAGRRRLPMTAPRALRIGKQVGLCPRRRGAASTSRRVATTEAVVCRWREGCTEFQDRGILRWRLSHLRAHLTSFYIPATSDAFRLVCAGHMAIFRRTQPIVFGRGTHLVRWQLCNLLALVCVWEIEIVRVSFRRS